MTWVETAVLDLTLLNLRLAELLKDPHPGLLTWIEAVGKTVEAMNKIVGGK